MTDTALISSIQTLVEEFNFSQFGFARLERPLSLDVYKTWLNKGYQGDMAYLEEHLEDKAQPQNILPQARSAIVITQNYLPHPRVSAPLPFEQARVALYAQGDDYHYWLNEKLDALCAKLKKSFPTEEFLSMTDSRPVLERDLAYRAGLGWIGKNSCLIHPKQGSLCFIGEVYTTLDLEPIQALVPDRCGKCRRCIDVCPTEALTDERQLDARKCISYLTIETKTDPAPEIRSGMKDWLFGCDLCQTVCPWNEKAFGPEMKSQTKDSPPDTKGLEEDLRFILQSSNKALNKTLRFSPLSRAGGRGLKRTALIIAGNYRLEGLIPDIQSTAERHPRLQELCRWALEQISASTEKRVHP